MKTIAIRTTTIMWFAADTGNKDSTLAQAQTHRNSTQGLPVLIFSAMSTIWEESLRELKADNPEPQTEHFKPQTS